MAVPGVDGAGEPVEGDPGLDGQLAEIPRFAEPVRHRPVRLYAQEPITLEVLCIEHHPGRVIDVALTRVEVVEGAGHRVVVTGLVDESLAKPVDGDASR